MRGLFVTIVAASVVGLSLLGLVDAERRYGPVDTILEPAIVEAVATGTYHARGDTSVFGFCPSAPCEPTTSIDLRIDGLPAGPYSATLEGGTTVGLGGFVRDGDGWALEWERAEDHTDKRRVVVWLAGQTVAAIQVRPTAEPMSLDGPVAASWTVPAAPVRLNEIGGWTVSTVAIATIPATPPGGWVFVAWLEGDHGVVHLGPLAERDGESVLDGRVERARLEDQDRIRIGLMPPEGDDTFPVLAAAV